MPDPRVTLIAYGTHGDVVPYLALARALAAGGVAVRLAAPAAFDDLARRLDVPFEALPGDPARLLTEPATRARLVAGDALGVVSLARTRLAPHIDALAEAARAAARGASLVVGTSVTSPLAIACAAAEHTRLALVELSPLTPDAVGVTSVLAPADDARVRQRWGLPAPPPNPDREARAAGVPMVHAFSAHLLPRHPSWGPSHVVSGAMALALPAQLALPGAHADEPFVRWLEDGPAPLYLGFGSLPATDVDDLVRLATGVAGALKRRAIVSVASSARSCRSGAHGDDVFLVGACSHGWLFPRCAAVVHHGGAGTVHAAMAAGVPQVICSVFSDQPFWGGLVEARTLGVHLPFRALDASRLGAAIDTALGSACVAAARDMAGRVAAEPGAAGAAAHLRAVTAS
ncbi:MAG: glycosyltransferase [Vicinamibacterales bacterium]